MNTSTVYHSRVALALHELASQDGPTLLLLHTLGGSAAEWGELPALWRGRVYALDFSGHGQSAWPRGSAYYPEILAGDVDAALAQIGPAAIAGAGLGAYIAMLIAGGRRDLVPAALLAPGRGLAGGGDWPQWEKPLLHHFDPTTGPPLPTGCDPHVCMLERDTRPIDYTTRFAAAARSLMLLEDGSERPPWWRAAAELPNTRRVDGDLATALRALAAAIG